MTKSEKIELLVSSDFKDTLARYAKESSVSIPDFIISLIYKYTHKDRRLLTSSDRAEILRILESAPSEPNKHLTALLTKHEETFGVVNYPPLKLKPRSK
jgi:uncharacterized protein (DUF1778 family)